MRFRLALIIILVLLLAALGVFGAWWWKHKASSGGADSTKIGSTREVTKPEVHRLNNSSAVSHVPAELMPKNGFIVEAKQVLFPHGEGQQTVITFGAEAKWAAELTSKKTSLSKTWQIVADASKDGTRLLYLSREKNTVKYELDKDNNLTLTYVEYAPSTNK